VTIIALIGDCTTTTAVAMAAAWPLDREVVILEADRSGGSLAGWLDTPTAPSLTTLVAGRGRRARDPDGDGGFAWPDVAPIVQSSAAGVRFIAAPIRSREASLAISEAERTLIPMLADLTSPTVIADVGTHMAADPLPVTVAVASAVVVLHRQDASSAGAAAVRLDRLVEVVEQLGGVGGRVLLGVIGDHPFDHDEVADYVASSTTTSVSGVHPIALDPLSASVLAGRSGVSARRLARLPLARSIGPIPVDPALTATKSAESRIDDVESRRLTKGIGR
jgi:hypothetical protein